ncbi:unnamed protein product [Bursaphelenchus okinawaensis]|uniref:G_PROTEIN_RECEP_F1_2 domain-containing protein n=1 Tax=Bursaphelenchus okinawaensis TaxID=465554 RepID=A0A811K0Y4_9BILA|nr:unnamed protein product [Bursaphelenchus okinawaensis]CAG9088431.1 unnamed protein product [Bursaphelenchus okinawaensis]
MCCTAISFFILPLTRRCIEVLLLVSENVTERFNVNVICCGISFISVTSGQSATICMLMLALEQHLAAYWVKDYEERTMRVGVILIGFTVIYSVSISLLLNYAYFKNFDYEHATYNCHPVQYHWEVAILFYASSFITCLIATSWLWLIQRYNKEQRKSRFITLHIRYQQNENVNSAMSITATLVGYMLYSFLGTTGSFLRKGLVDYFGEHSKPNEAIVSLGYLLVEAYALFHMACFMYYNNAMRKIVQQDLEFILGKRVNYLCTPSSKIACKMSSNEETAEYFRQFGQAWN